MKGILYRIPVIRSLMRKWDLFRFQRHWRKINQHNNTYACCHFPVECVQIGKQTYGLLNIISYWPPAESLQIGSFVSIAAQVRFILSGNHQTHTLTTFPIHSWLTHRQYPKDAESKGEIIVEDEVWIGYGATILSGVTLGKGSIIAAGSVVTRDIPPYAIAAGNPAKVVKFRLPKDVINIVKDCYLKDLAPESLMQHLNQLYTPLQTAEQAAQLIALLKNGNK